MIYLDNAATTLVKPVQVSEAIVQALRNLGNSARGVHGYSLEAARTVYQTRVKIAELFNCPRPDYVIFTCNATEALNTAISGLIKPGDTVVSTVWEHNSVLRPLYRLQDEQNVQLKLVSADNLGHLNYEQLKRELLTGVKAVVCTAASNLTGERTDLQRIGILAKRAKALLIVDASQAAGEIEIDMQALGIDVLCFTGHKGLLGPQGTGGLCCREGLEWRPFKVGGTGVQSYSRQQPAQMPVLLESGTLNGHGIAGLSAAVDFIRQTGIAQIKEHLLHLTAIFASQAGRIPGISLCGYGARELAGGNVPALGHAPIISLNVADIDSGTIADILAEEYGIATRSGAHCAPLLHQALGTQGQGAVRFSFSWFTTESDIVDAIQALKHIVARLS